MLTRRAWSGERAAASCAGTPPRWDSDERRVGYAESVLWRACGSELCGHAATLAGKERRVGEAESRGGELRGHTAALAGNEQKVGEAERRGGKRRASRRTEPALSGGSAKPKVCIAVRRCSGMESFGFLFLIRMCCKS
jgi:hypothetical protein